MFEDLAELVIGPWGLAAVALFAASKTDKGRDLIRKGARNVIKGWFVVSDKASALREELKEYSDDLIAEVKAERNGSDTKTSATSHKKKAEKIEKPAV
jgi:hypothetical protein